MATVGNNRSDIRNPMLEALADPKHEEHEQYVEWIGGSFDSEAFNLNEVNRMLRGIR